MGVVFGSRLLFWATRSCTVVFGETEIPNHFLKEELINIIIFHPGYMTLTLHIYWTDSRAYPLNRGTARKFTIKNIDIRVWLDRVIVASNKRQRI